jgi:S1-C subfamily serine protease
MINSAAATCLAQLVSLALAGAAFAVGVMDADLAPLGRLDLAGARQAVENLNKLAARQSGAEKFLTERLATAIKNLFTAEYRVGVEARNRVKAEMEAARQDKLARDWLVPNGFGKVNEAASQAARFRAGEIRARAAKAQAASREELVVQLREVDSLVHDFHKARELNVVLALAEASSIINERTLPPGMFEPSFTSEAVASVREFIQLRRHWLQAAGNAEQMANFEEALRYYTKARDQPGKQRCATELAQRLEAEKFFGSAIDYYEIAGDAGRAAELRRNHPDLHADDYRKLDPEDLCAKIAPCCVRILNGESAGNGFFFKQGGFILTNRHVVANPAPITVKLEDGRSFGGQLLAEGGDQDLAIVKIDFHDHDTIRFRMTDEIRIGLPAALIGCPDVTLPAATITSARISKADQSFGSNPVYQLDVPVNHGISGAPVVDDCGHLLGILTFGLSDTDKDRFSYAIRGVAVRDFVKKHVP